MNSNSAIIRAFDLKRIYQRNLLLGFGIAGGLHLLVIGIVALIAAACADIPTEAPTVIIGRSIDVLPPPVVDRTHHPVNVETPEGEIKPAIGIPEPVPDNEAPEDIEYVSQRDLINMAPDNPIENLDDINIDVDVEGILQEILPDRGTFTPYDIAPVQINIANPVYPPIAQNAGVQGAVWVKALVDQEGIVREVVIEKDSGTNAGFEEAAIDAAYKTTWKPAIANGMPVAVWVTYKVEFVLK